MDLVDIMPYCIGKEGQRGEDTCAMNCFVIVIEASDSAGVSSRWYIS